MVILTRRLRDGVIVIQALGITAPRSLPFESRLRMRRNEEPQNPKPASREPNCHSANYPCSGRYRLQVPTEPRHPVIKPETPGRNS